MSEDPLNGKQWDVWQGDCLDLLKRLPDGCVDCCVTSPPYYGLRDYGHPDQIGLEQSPSEYVAKMCEVFGEVWRVLKHDGTLWLNLGDSYAGSAQTGGTSSKETHQRAGRMFHTPRPNFDVAPKNLLGIPWRVAFALQDAGWYLRQDIIWAKPNPMPESVTDRCTKAHEYVFLLSKSERYYYDAEAVAEPVTQSTIERLGQAGLLQQASSERVPGKTNGAMKAVGPRFGGSKYGDDRGKRNRRSVWTIGSEPFKGAHFAVMPSALVEPCILAGCPPGGIVLDPFGGSGTVGAVALKHGRRALLCELNEQYISEILRPRLECAAAQPRLEFDEPQERKPEPKQLGMEGML